MPRWTIIVAFVLVLWLATSAGLCTAKSDAPKSLCRPRLHQAAGNLEEMGRIDVNTTRLLHAQVTLRSPSSLSECLIRRLSSSVSHSLSFIRYLSSLCLIPCVSFCVSSSVSHSLCLIRYLSSFVSHPLCLILIFILPTNSHPLVPCVSSSVSHPSQCVSFFVSCPLCPISCVSLSVSHDPCLILCVSFFVSHSLYLLFSHSLPCVSFSFSFSFPHSLSHW